MLENRVTSSLTFRQLLSRIDPRWASRPPEVQDEWVDWYSRTARAIARQFAGSFRDPSHDASDVLQDIFLKLFLKFRDEDAPHRLLAERPCMRNLMEWKGLDRVDWENAERRSARRRTALPEDEVGLLDDRVATPERYAEVADAERAFRSAIRDPADREAYRMFREGRDTEEVARALGRDVRETREVRDRLCRGLSAFMAMA